MATRRSSPPRALSPSQLMSALIRSISTSVNSTPPGPNRMSSVVCALTSLACRRRCTAEPPGQQRHRDRGHRRDFDVSIRSNTSRGSSAMVNAPCSSVLRGVVVFFESRREAAGLAAWSCETARSEGEDSSPVRRKNASRRSPHGRRSAGFWLLGFE